MRTVVKKKMKKINDYVDFKGTSICEAIVKWQNGQIEAIFFKWRNVILYLYLA